MKKLLKFLILFSTSLFIFNYASLLFAGDKQSLDKIVATVNDTIITESELTDAMGIIKKQLQTSQVSLPPADAFRKQVLDQLINKKLQMQLAEQMGIHVNDVDIDKAIGRIAEANKMSVKELYAQVAEGHVSASEYRKQIREEMLIQQVQQQAVGTKINITPQEVNDFMRSKTWQAYNTKEYHLEDILIALPDTPSTQDIANAKKRAELLFSKIKQGLPFKEAAVAESGDTNALQGGDLGWRKLPEIPTAFANELIHLKANDLFGPIQTSNGFHIILLAGIRSVGNGAMGDEHHQVEQLIFQRKLEENLQNWITKIRSEAFIKLSDES